MDRKSDSQSKTVVITRFSAVGDVAMTIPLLYSLSETYPLHRFVFVSRERFGQLFINKPKNLDFIGINPDNYKGIYRKADPLLRIHDLRWKVNSRFIELFDDKYKLIVIPSQCAHWRGNLLENLGFQIATPVTSVTGSQ